VTREENDLMGFFVGVFARNFMRKEMMVVIISPPLQNLTVVPL